MMIKPNKRALSLFALSIVSATNVFANEISSIDPAKTLNYDVKLTQFTRGAE